MLHVSVVVCVHVYSCRRIRVDVRNGMNLISEPLYPLLIEIWVAFLFVLVNLQPVADRQILSIK